ncbi:hypothetical protein [Dactylosporangium sp. CA-139066]|uniref:hypothetical protein n=1 Tax=Dactylosporangium sp. CA-139066 TaxID=3239930 RepID=UPI003D8DCED6
MKYLRVLLVAALASGALAGCGGDEPLDTSAAGAPASTAPAPKDVLLKAVQTLDKASFTFTVKQAGMSGGGRVDAKAKAASVEMSGKVEGTTISLAYIVIAPDVWLKADLGAAGNKQLGITKTKWMHLDPAKVEDKTQLPIDTDGNPAIGTAGMLQGAADVKQADATHFSGVVDVTAADSLVAPDEQLLKKVGDKAKAVPFTATVDDQGRLTALKLDGSAIDPGLTIDLVFSGFDAVKPITKPSGAINAPASLYAMFTTS